MGVALTGVFSGIDSNSLVNQIMASEQTTLKRLQQDRSAYLQQQKAVGDIESRMKQLKDALNKLRDVSGMRSVNVSSSDETILDISGEPGAIEGGHTVEVNALASAHRMVQSAGVSSLEDTLGAGQFVYSYDGTTRTLTTTDNTTLEDLRDLIENDAGNPGVHASILEYDDQYLLVLSGANAGSDYDIAVEAGTTLSGFESSDFSVTRQAQDSQIKVDGFPPGADEWIERSSNQITDVIPGVTLDLQSVGTASVTVSRVTSSVKSKLSNLASIYNGIVGALEQHAGYDEATKTSGVLQGDVTLNTLPRLIRRPLTGQVPGFSGSVDAYTLSAQIGVEFDSDGRIQIDDDVLGDAVDEDYEAVLRLIGAADTGSVDSTDIQFSSAYQTEGGTYDLQVEYDENGDVSAARIKLENEAEYRELLVDGASLTGEAGNPEQGLELTVVTGGVSETKSYTVNVRQGFAGRMYDTLEGIMDSTTGVFAVKDDRLETQLDAIDEKIERENERLVDKEERLVAQYARLESSLSQLSSMQAAYQSLFAMAGTSGMGLSG